MRTPTRLADQWKRVATASSAHSGRALAMAWRLDRQFAAFEQARLLGRILRLRSVRTRLRGQRLVPHLLGKFETQESATAAVRTVRHRRRSDLRIGLELRRYLRGRSAHHRQRQQQTSTRLQLLFAMAVRQEAVVPHLDEAARQDVLHEAAQELFDGKRIRGQVSFRASERAVSVAGRETFRSAASQDRGKLMMWQ
jgi:hypothetical protein